MGIFAALFGRRGPEFDLAGVRSMRGDGKFRLDVVGESHYQPALSEICGGRTREGHDFRTVAVLRPEPSNPHDPNAVRIEIACRPVGHLSRADAVRHLSELDAAGLARTQPVSCGARIVGGWEERERGRVVDRGSFGVRLDLVYPLVPTD